MPQPPYGPLLSPVAAYALARFPVNVQLPSGGLSGPLIQLSFSWGVQQPRIEGAGIWEGLEEEFPKEAGLILSHCC